MTKQTLPTNDYIKESIIHNYVYSKTNNSSYTRLNPICPIIYNSTIMDNNCAIEFFKLMNTSTNNNHNSIFNYLIYRFANPKYKLGICFMERIYSEFSLNKYIFKNTNKNRKSFSPLRSSSSSYSDNSSNTRTHSDINDPLSYNKRILLNMSRYVIITLFNCGIFHNDAHLGNIITQNFNKKNIEINANTVRSLFLIDFGFSSFHNYKPINIETITKEDIYFIYQTEIKNQSSANWIYYNIFNNDNIAIDDDDIAMIKQIHCINNTINTNVNIICDNYSESDKLFEYSNDFITNFNSIHNIGDIREKLVTNDCFPKYIELVNYCDKLGISNFIKEQYIPNISKPFIQLYHKSNDYTKFMNNIKNIF